MVANYGMDDRLGNISYNEQSEEYSFKKPYSEQTAKLIDEEVKNLIDEAYERTVNLLKEKRKELEAVAQELLDKEVIYQSDFEKLAGPSPYHKTQQQEKEAAQGKTDNGQETQPSDEQETSEKEGAQSTTSEPGQPKDGKETGNGSSTPSKSGQTEEEQKKDQ